MNKNDKKEIEYVVLVLSEPLKNDDECIAVVNAIHEIPNAKTIAWDLYQNFSKVARAIGNSRECGGKDLSKFSQLGTTLTQDYTFADVLAKYSDSSDGWALAVFCRTEGIAKLVKDVYMDTDGAKPKVLINMVLCKKK